MEEVIDNNWKNDIRKAYKDFKNDICWLYPNNSTETFLTVIWSKSMKAFDIPREVQVMVDDKEDLYISYGTPGFVSFQGQEDEEFNGAPMKLPIACWIHTHPFGTAFWSMTDWKSLKTWKPVLTSAIVLGDNEYLAYDLNTQIAKKILYGTMEPPEVVIEFKTEEDELKEGEEE
jgi:proteasome lid subunit RPN8/RPN11